MAAFAIEGFLVPNTILDGGVIGIGIIVSNLTGFSLSILTILFNLPFLILGAKKMGNQFIVKSAFSMIVFSVFAAVFEDMSAITEEALLAVCFGGVFLGFGVGLVIRFGGCLDGTETVALILNRKTNIPVGRTVLMFNVVVYAIAGLFFGFDRAMYSLLTYFITSKVLDLIENGMDQAKAAMIITEDADSVSREIYQKLGRTVTIIEGKGFVSGDKKIIYCVLTKLEIRILKEIVQTHNSSFVTISDVNEIVGSHIKMTDLKKMKESEQ